MLDNKYIFTDKEKKWQEFWLANAIYKFNKNTEKRVYSIDTPPPTVNGKIHMGHLSSYIHIDIVARLKRMSGYEVYFPFGYDDNGLPTDKYVEKKNKIRAKDIPREEYVELCLKETHELEKAFKDLYIHAGFSSEMDKTYSTISKRSQEISQSSFLDLYDNGYLEYKKKPALWCCDCQTSVAISEVEKKEMPSQFNYIKFYIEGNKTEYLEVATTRPEYLAACVCVFVNPGDKKRAKFIGKKVHVPLYNFTVEVIADKDALLDKGTGVVMCCTFGDEMDMQWQQRYNLPIKLAINEYGRMTALAGKYEGQKIAEARTNIIADLKEAGLLYKEEPIEHAVNTHERCGKPIEIFQIDQWFIKTLDIKDKLLEAGDRLNWHPESMKIRYMNWVKNLAWDWCISRQRYFGVPIPVWYCEKCGAIILPDKKDLPVNPLSDKPSRSCKCGCKNLIPEKDVFDTWATSSLTPQLSTDLITEKGLSGEMAPMSLRPNAHDNIRVWDFYTIVKSLLHFDELPWRDLMISGFITSPDGGKLAKSKQNAADSPEGLLATMSADVVRYWAADCAMGRDRIFNIDDLKKGARLINKLYNASKFVLQFLDDFVMEGAATTADKFEKKHLRSPKLDYRTDECYYDKFTKMQIKFEKSIKKYELGEALTVLEKFFWDFCDNYIELVKNRLYKPEIFKEDEKFSAQFYCYLMLRGMLKMFAPFIPHVTEEIYQSYFIKQEKAGVKSIHTTPLYGDITDLKNSFIISSNEEIAKDISNILERCRKFKSENNLSLKDELSEVELVGYKLLERINNTDKRVTADLIAACSIKNLKFTSGKEKEIRIKN